MGYNVIGAYRWILPTFELYLTIESNWVYHSVSRQQVKYFAHVILNNGLEKTIMEEMVAGRRCRGKPRQDKDGRNTSHICLVRCHQQSEWWRICIDFAKTFRQRRPVQCRVCGKRGHKEKHHTEQNYH